jgi:hypothetical protein
MLACGAPLILGSCVIEVSDPVEFETVTQLRTLAVELLRIVLF